MKRIPASDVRTAPTSFIDRLARIIPQQSRYHADRARSRERAKIMAAGTSAMLYQRVHGGLRCTCGVTGYESILDDGGQLSPESITQIARQALDNDRGVEIFNVSDMTVPAIDDPLTPDIDESVDTDPLGSIDITGFDEIKCAVCFGSGYVPGYRLANGYRAALIPAMVTATDYDVDETIHPNVASGGAYMEFEWTLPLIPVIFRIWDDEVTPHAIIPTEMPALGENGTFRFVWDGPWTHIEIVSPSVGIPVDLTAQPSQTLSEAEYLETDFQIPAPYIVPLLSIIIENRSGKVWQVKAITPVRDNENKIVYQTVNARVVRANELPSLLIGPNSSTAPASVIAGAVVSNPNSNVDYNPVGWQERDW